MYVYTLIYTHTHTHTQSPEKDSNVLSLKISTDFPLTEEVTGSSASIVRGHRISLGLAH